MIITKKNLCLLIITTFISSAGYCEEGQWTVLKKSTNQSEQQQVQDQVRKVYENYSAANPACNYPAEPGLYTYPKTSYTLMNPYAAQKDEKAALKFKIINFVINGPSVSDHPECGQISVKCAASQKFSASFYCERIHKGPSSESNLLADPLYNKYIAYQTIYNQMVIPNAKNDFGKLKQFYPLDAFPLYSDSQMPNPNYKYSGVIFTSSPQYYPAPVTPPAPNSPNYNNGNYGGLFVGSAENLKSICRSIQYDHLSPEDASIRFNEFLGLPPDSPDVQRTLIVMQLRNNPHVSGTTDGNLFRPCPTDGKIDSAACQASALVIPHDCNNAPLPYDGKTVNLFLANQFYSSYCKASPNKQSGMPIYYPWTGQGFTYDWYPWNFKKNLQGTSEYVAAVNSTGNNNMEVVKQTVLKNFLVTCDF